MIPGILDRVSAFLRMRERISVWQWAERHRILAKGVSARSLKGPMPYRTIDAPHQRGPQAAFTDPNVQCTILCMASQVGGKSEMIGNMIAYCMHWQPTSAILMYPTLESAQRYSKRKFSPLVEATPVLDRLITPARVRDSGNTVLVKQFVGGSVFFVGANSPASLRQATAQLLIGDEIDSYESGVGDEGDAVELLFKRGESHPRCIKVLASTPTIAGHSEIWKWFEQSDQQYWHVRCPKCDGEQTLEWKQVAWPKDKPEDAYYQCAHCEAHLSDADRLAMYHAGYWKSKAAFNGIAGFHLNGIYCPWPAQKGFKNRLHQMAVEYLRAEQKGDAARQVRVNTFLCEPWQPKTEEPPDKGAIALRLEECKDEIPEEVVYVSATVDVQSNRLELDLVGWGIGEESWGLGFHRFFGPPGSKATWEQLDKALNRTFQHPSGGVLRVAMTFIDSGGVMDTEAFATHVYRFVLPRQIRCVFACKGASRLGAPLVVERPQRNGILLQLIGTDEAKSQVYYRLRINTPGPGYMHFLAGRGYDEEFFEQLTSERVMIEGTKRRWIKTRSRNEALDLRAYHIAAFHKRRVNLEACAATLRRHAEPKKPEAPPSAIVAPAVKQAQRLQQRPRMRMGFVNWR